MQLKIIRKYSLFLFLVTILAISCNEKNRSSFKKKSNTNDSICKELSQKIQEYESSNFFKFYEIYKNETKTLQDTLLISRYESILSKDELVNNYVKERISTIKNFKEEDTILNKFRGKYLLKPIFNKAYSPITSIEIRNDSCFLFKKDSLIDSKEISLIYSYNKFLLGTFRMKQYQVNFVKPEFIIIRDHSCLDCQNLEFIK